MLNVTFQLLDTSCGSLQQAINTLTPEIINTDGSQFFYQRYFFPLCHRAAAAFCAIALRCLVFKLFARATPPALAPRNCSSLVNARPVRRSGPLWGQGFPSSHPRQEPQLGSGEPCRFSVDVPERRDNSLAMPLFL
jgi:hypothetical protein